MDSNPNRFAEAFPAKYRGVIANEFYAAVRSGLAYPKQICSAVYRRVVEREKEAIRWQREGGTPWGEVRRLMEEDQMAALDFALEIQMRESKSPEEKAAEKEEQARQGRLEYMRSQPPTDKQVAVLRKLGYTDEIRDKAHASELIEARKTW